MTTTSTTAMVAIAIVTAALVASGAATQQLAFAQEVTCAGCRFLDVSGSGTIECADGTTYPSTIDITARTVRGGDARGNLTIITDSGLVLFGSIESGRITGARYSLEGIIIILDDICGTTDTTSFSVSGRIGTQVPINFQSSAIASSSFTGTARITSTPQT